VVAQATRRAITLQGGCRCMHAAAAKAARALDGTGSNVWRIRSGLTGSQDPDAHSTSRLPQKVHMANYALRLTRSTR
jgi:hypothetical protein